MRFNGLRSRRNKKDVTFTGTEKEIKSGNRLVDELALVRRRLIEFNPISIKDRSF